MLVLKKIHFCRVVVSTQHKKAAAHSLSTLHIALHSAFRALLIHLYSRLWNQRTIAQWTGWKIRTPCGKSWNLVSLPRATVWNCSFLHWSSSLRSCSFPHISNFLIVMLRIMCTIYSLKLVAGNRRQDTETAKNKVCVLLKCINSVPQSLWITTAGFSYDWEIISEQSMMLAGGSAELHETCCRMEGN